MKTAKKLLSLSLAFILAVTLLCPSPAAFGESGAAGGAAGDEPSSTTSNTTSNTPSGAASGAASNTTSGAASGAQNSAQGGASANDVVVPGGYLPSTSWTVWDITHAYATSAQISITSMGSWSASTSASWLSISPSTMYAIAIYPPQVGTTTATVYVTANGTPYSRTGYIYITGSGGTKVVTVNQPGGAPAITAPTTSWSNWDIAHANATSTPITISSSVQWYATVSASWITLSPTSGGAGTTTSTVYVAANTTGYGRSGYIYISNSSGTKTVAVSQPAGAPVITYTPPTTSWSNWDLTHANAASTPINITSTGAWSASTSASWISINPSSVYVVAIYPPTTGTTTATVSVAANATGYSRTGYIYITNSYGTKTVAVSQPAGAPVSYAPTTSWSVWDITHANAVSSQVCVTSSASWSAYASVGWIAINPAYGGPGSTNIMVSVTANNTGYSRTGCIYITSPGGTKTLTVNQAAGAPITYPPTASWVNWNVPHCNAASTPITITSSASWTANTTASWLTINPMYGFAGTTTATVYVAANTTSYSRTGYIYVVGAGGTTTITVYQPAGYVAVGPPTTSWSSWNAPSSSSASTSIAITSSASWTASTTAGWITINPTYGYSGTMTATVSVAANTTSSSRTGYINIVNQGGTKTVSVYQPAGASPASPPNTSWAQWGTQTANASSVSLTIMSPSASWTAYTTVGWLTISPTYGGAGNTNVTVYAAANTTTSIRTGYIYITNSAGTKQLLVSQPAGAVAVGPPSTSWNTWDITHCYATSTLLNILSSVFWTASCSASWITLSHYSGSALSTSCTVHIAANNSSYSRTGYIYITSLLGTRTVTICQPGW